MGRRDRFEELEEKMAGKLKPSRQEVSVSRQDETETPEIQEGPTVALTVRLPQPLWEAAHYARIRTRKAVNKIIVEALERYLRELGHWR